MLALAVITLVVVLLTFYVVLKMAFGLQGVQEKITMSPVGKLLQSFAG